MHTHTDTLGLNLEFDLNLSEAPGTLSGSLYPPVSTLALGPLFSAPPISTGHVWWPKQLGPGFPPVSISMSVCVRVSACALLCLKVFLGL